MFNFNMYVHSYNTRQSRQLHVVPKATLEEGLWSVRIMGVIIGVHVVFLCLLLIAISYENDIK